MRSFLFWKILLSFCVAFYIIFEGINIFWFLSHPAQQDPVYMGYAQMTVTAAATIVSLRGEHAAREQIAKWQVSPKELQIAPANKSSTINTPLVLAETIANSPQGSKYRVTFYDQHKLSLNEATDVPREILVGWGAGGLILSLAFAWYFTKPIKSIQTGFANLARGNFDTRLKDKVGRRRDEIADLARDFDIMAAQLQELVSARDRLLADVSHELRTPLARLNLAVELLRQDPSRFTSSLDRISKEMLKLDDIVTELLALAKLESSSERSEEYINLAELLRAVTEDARYEARVKSVEIVLNLESDSVETQWVMPGNGKLIYRAIENILRNAVRYSPDGGIVRVDLKKLGDDFSIQVSDQGTGITDQDMAKLFKPFGISADGSGFGLGLAIAQRAVAVHRGSILARNRAPHGLEMEVRLPSRG